MGVPKFIPKVYRVFHQVELGGDTTTGQLIEKLRKRGWKIDDRITEENFPISPSGEIEKVEMGIIYPGRHGIEPEEGHALRLLHDERLQRPTVQRTLRFIEHQAFKCRDCIDLQAEYLMFLHEPWFDKDGQSQILYACYLYGWYLGLGNPSRGFKTNCGFAGFR